MYQLQGKDVPKTNIAKITSTPVIDGILNDACWKKIKPLTNFTIFNSTSLAPTQTTVKIATDRKWLFIAFECMDSSLKPALKRYYQKDAASHESDSVEVFIVPGTEDRYWQFKIAENGEQTEQFRLKKNGVWRTYTNYDIHWRSSGRRTKQGFCVEIAIPLFYFEDKTKKERVTKSWKVNFCRNDMPVHGSAVINSSWAPCKKSFHNIACFGVINNSPESCGQPFAPVLTGIGEGAFSDASGIHTLPVQVALRNDSATGGTLKLTVSDIGKSGRKSSAIKSINLPGRKNLNVNLELGYKNQTNPDPVATITIKDKLGVWRQSMKSSSGFEPRGVLEIFTGRNYYTTEKSGFIWYKILLPEKQLKSYFLEYTIEDSGGKIVVPPGKPGIRPGLNPVKLNIGKLKTGSYKCKLKLKKTGNGKLLESAVCAINKLPALKKGSEIKIDRYNRCILVNRKPFFPFGLCVCESDPLPELKKLGFNMAFRWSLRHDCFRNESLSIREAVNRDRLLNDAAELKMMIIEKPVAIRDRIRFQKKDFVTKFEKWFSRDLPKAIEALKHKPQLLGYLCMDEPSDRKVYPGGKNLIDYLDRFAAEVRRMDPYHPIFNNFSHTLPASKKWTHLSDMLSVYIYWVAHVTRGEQLRDYAKASNLIAEKQHKPLIVMPMNESTYSMAEINVSPEEQRAQTYILLASGVRGIYYFCYSPLHTASARMFKALASEIKTISPALMRREPEQKILFAQGGLPAILVSLRVMPDGAPILIMVNKRDRKVELNCRLPWLSGASRLRFAFDGKKSISLDNAGFQLSFKPLETRVLFVEGFKITDLDRSHKIIISENYPEASGTGAGTEVVPGSGFSTPGFWTPDSKRPAEMKIVREKSHPKQKYLQVISKSRQSLRSIVSEPFTLLPGRKYKFSVSLRYDLSERRRNKRKLTHDYCGVSIWLKPLVPKDGFKAAAAAPYLKMTGWQEFTKYVATADKPVKARMIINLSDCAGSAWFRKISVVDQGKNHARKSRQHKNLVANSSFEFAKMTGWPDRWTVFRYNPWEKGFIGSGKAPWEQCTENPYHGKNCLRIRSDAPWYGMRNAPYARIYHGIQLKYNQPYVFSIYMRSDVDKLPVTVDLRNLGKQTFIVGKTWRRYSLSGIFKAPKAGVGTGIRIFFPSKVQGTLWLDAVQLEAGNTPTQYSPDSYAPRYPFAN